MIVICVLGVINFVAIIDVMVRFELVTGSLELLQTFLVDPNKFLSHPLLSAEMVCYLNSASNGA